MQEHNRAMRMFKAMATACEKHGEVWRHRRSANPRWELCLPSVMGERTR